jgi:4-hydroxy-2-oxoheptanedioate aldolase
MYPNPLKQKIKSGQLVLGTALPVFDPSITTLSCQTGIDFLWIETEHAPHGTESLGAVPVLARNQGVAPLIRVAWNDPHLIKKAVDVGAVAIMVPQVNSAEEAARAVQYTYYPPLGQRGISPYWPIIAGEDWLNVIRTANEEIVLIVQIESVQAYEQLDAIAAIPGIDVLLVGPMDLSASLGKITDVQSREVQQIMEEIPRRLAGSGIAVGTTLSDLSELEQKYRWGYRFLNVGNPIRYGVNALTQHIHSLRTNPAGKG